MSTSSGSMGNKLILFLSMAFIAIALLLSGCGGGSNSTVTAASTGWKQVGATYVGRYACRDCHATIDDQFATNPKGFTGSTGVHTRKATGDCARCHVTGYGEPGGGTIDAGGDSDPTNVPLSGLYGITCESCHGPGSKHVAAGSREERIAQITREPKSSNTCDNCHTGSSSGFKLLSAPVAPVDDTTLATQNPGLRGLHHAPASAVIKGVLAYGHTTPMASPHSTLPNPCIDCHLEPTLNPATGKVDHGADQLHPNTDTSQAKCASCHGGLTRSELPLQVGIKEMLIKLGGEDPLLPGEPLHPGNKATGGLLNDYVVAHGIDIASNLTPDDPYVKAYKAARYNFLYVLNDASNGVHNPGLSRKLLEDAITAMTPAP